MVQICPEISTAPSYDIFKESVIPSVRPKEIVWIYCLCDENLNVRYIGKTSSLTTRVSRHRHPKSKTHRDNWLRKMIRDNRPVIIVLIEECDRGDWIEREKYWIKFGREQQWELTNHTDGGEGLSGHTYVMTQERKDAISRAKKGKVVVSEQQKETLRQKNLGKKLSEETKRLISLGCKGKTGHKGNKFWLGKKHSDKSKQKMSEAAQKRPQRTVSLEAREKMRQAALLREERFRQNPDMNIIRKEWSKRGGEVAIRKMTIEERKERSKKMLAARWGKKKP